MTMWQDLNPDQTAELLRIALPQMTRHQIAATPNNYAVWFLHVSGMKPDLSAEIEKHIEAGQPFTQDFVDGLFCRFISECDIAQFEKVRQEMVTILRDVEDSMISAGRNVDHYSGRISGISHRVASSNSLDEIKDLLRTLIEETRTMQEASQRLREHFDQKSAEIIALREELEHERKRAVTDPLTGLPNRQALLDALDEALGDNSGGQTALVMLDIDHFKSINDRYGHLIGDRVLRFVANLLEKNTKGRDTAARYGGEEFAILLPQTNLDGACSVAEALRRAIAEAKLVRSDTKESLGKITASLGVAVYRRGEDIMNFIERADQALYAAKAAGRDQVKTERAVLQRRPA